MEKLYNIQTSKVTLVNHSSLLFNLDKNIFLTDFWNISPAFGSWLPSALPFYNPTYLAALSYEKNFYLVISHAHDDHIDDDYLQKYFNKKMKIIINEFPSPALKKRLNKIGFENIITIKNKVTSINNFDVISIFDSDITNDDASLAFRNRRYCIFHGNDNWNKLNSENLEKVISFKKKRKFLYASQANSASGYPLTYPQIIDRYKVLKQKIKKMLLSGLKNAEDTKADYFLPYAGYSKPYVYGENYENEGFDPIYNNLFRLIKNNKIPNLNKMINMFCGGTINLDNGKITYPFNFDEKKLINITDKFYKNEKIYEKCDTFRPDLKNNNLKSSDVRKYMLQFNEFTLNYLERFPGFYNSIINKKIKFTIIDSKSYNKKFSVSMEIGSGRFLKENNIVNKEFKIKINLFKAVISKKIVFENLYTGFQSKIYRYPLNIYNRDITVYLIMFGYKYAKQKILQP
jgi:hypothetical protein